MKFTVKRYILPSLIATVGVAQFMMMPTNGVGRVNGIWQGTTPANFSGKRRSFQSNKDARRVSAHNGSKALHVRGGAKAEEHKSSLSSSVFNLVNNVAGAGILTLASGVASGTGWVPAIFICATLAVLSGHCFSIIGEACELTGESNFKGLWKRTIGENSAYLVDSMIAIMCLSCSVIYSGILGDVFTPLLKQAGFPDQWNGRTSNIVIITAIFLLPLSLIKDLSALAFTSVLGFGSILYTVLFILTRYFDGSYMLPDGKFLQDGLIMTPTFKQASMWNFGFKALVLASNFGLAYIAHYNAPNFYRSLKDANTKRFRSMVGISFFTLAILYTATMMAGFATFGDVCQGNILLNYHPNDLLSTLGRLATGLSILFGFPLVACGAREAIIGLASSFGNDTLGSEKNNFSLVAGILTFVTIISCTVKDVSLVVGLTGAALGSTIVYICPPFIYSKAIALAHGADSPASRRAKLNLALVPFGLFIGVLGCIM
eukprot:CAMPEP_0116155076 /NCGR_PEP_ID=MMETSP0329-20121206/22119_1 /TAXON_ID=697910 /ORGANISM="Pseudo-nitzschia arenysensis, Strain B593" /LENGTH=487 /DNA_ID=CAMNT_0003652095 /DNA_START=130 /DNA_END=1590 /DNA_ORIENTATION=+